MGKAIGSVVGGSGWSRRGSSHRQPSFTWDWSGLGGDVWSRGWRVGWRGSRSSGGEGTWKIFFPPGYQRRSAFFFGSHFDKAGLSPSALQWTSTKSNREVG